MTDNKIKPHWSFWLICVVALIWSLMGCMNFFMQSNAEMLASFPDSVQSLVASRPLWATIAFALAVFGGVFAALVLLLKRSLAYYLFVVSFLGALVTNIHTFQMSSDPNIWVGSVMSILIAAFLIWYSKLAKRKGWVN